MRDIVSKLNVFHLGLRVTSRPHDAALLQDPSHSVAGRLLATFCKSATCHHQIDLLLANRPRQGMWRLHPEGSPDV